MNNSQLDGKPLIKLADVSKTYHSPAGDFPALKELDAQFFPGEFISVIGKSGSGKSTMVNMITGIDHPSSGQVLIDDRNIHQMSESQMAAWRGHNLGVIFQFFQLLPHLTLLENVMLPMDFCSKYSPSQRIERGLELLAKVELEDCASSLPAAVSGGEQQRAAIARALANDPPIIIADEPSGNLDLEAANNVHRIFQELVQGGKTIIMVTHDPELAAKTDRSLLLSDGELIDPGIAKALDGLPHPRLLWLTHQMQRLDPHADQHLNEQLQDDLGLLIVSQGEFELEIACRENGRRRLRLGPGSYLSLVDAQHSSCDVKSISHVGTKSKAYFLPRSDYEDWMKKSPADRDWFSKRSNQGLADRIESAQPERNE